jgi:hypothetical protein
MHDEGAHAMDSSTPKVVADADAVVTVARGLFGTMR